MHGESVHPPDLATALHGALERGELRLHFQPAIRLSDGAMRGAEALVRWQHPDFGLVPPADFIPLAEEAGLMREIGRWVLTEACRQVTRWNQVVRPALFVSVNLSAQQVLVPDAVDDACRALAETGTDPDHICVEVAESSLARDGERVIGALNELRAVGVRLAIDNFGAGQSPLGSLRRLPVDILKLDRVLAQGLDDERGIVVARAVIDMARALGFATVAEGVETAGQMQQLQALGCDLAQGYFLGRPDDAGAMSGLLG